MTAEELDRRKAEAMQKATRALNLLRAGGLVVIGVLGFVATASGKLFTSVPNGQAQGWLYDNLGQEGATKAAFALFGLLILVGVIWAWRIVRGLRGG